MTSAATFTCISVPSKAAPRLRLHYLDGLRGLAALYVVLYHCYMQIQGSLLLTAFPVVSRLAVYLLNFGHLAVDVFIVLSGYCLMLPVARSADGQLSGTVGRFFQRRAMRILPPYYAALLLCLLLIRFVPALGKPSAANWDIALPAFTPGVLVSHLLLVHNLSAGWIFKIDYSMWSVATEWQIYFLFPFLMLPVWRRFGIAALLAAVFAFWMAIHILFHARFDGAGLHLASLFSFGMAGAIVGFSQKPSAISWRERIPWGLCTLVSFLALAGILSWRPALLEKHTSHIDLLAGFCATCLLVYCTQHLSKNTASRPAVLAVMESGFAVGIGRFSYSLYLIHAPVLALSYAALRGLHLDSVITLGLVILWGVPLSLLFAYLFYLACERPFLEKRGAAPVKEITSEMPMERAG